MLITVPKLPLKDISKGVLLWKYLTTKGLNPFIHFYIIYIEFFFVDKTPIEFKESHSFHTFLSATRKPTSG